ncbi:MAG: cellulase family glycosylhydrolase [Fibrobacterales bacterium]
MISIAKTILLATIFVTSAYSSGFLRAAGTRIVDGTGENFIIRSMGIGGWFVQEPYMFGLNEAANEGQHKIFNDIKDLIGTEKFEQYRTAWLDNFFREADVQELKASGFNTIRISLHYNNFTLPIEEEPVAGQDTWLPEGFDRLDSLIAWCARSELYIILDLHAAPGGQGYNGNINDYDPSKPSLWESEENKRKTVAIWSNFAERYADEPWVGGFDPMNEPNWSFITPGDRGCGDTENGPLRDMYARLIPAIRQHDTNHIIFIEGNCWGNNHNGLWPLPVHDTNVGISFHKYWNENNYASISGFIGMRDAYNAPLWMSESGENSNTWYNDAVRLLEAHNIGWSWWTWKKVHSGSGSYKIMPEDDYFTLTHYWNNGGPKPDTAFAFDAIMGFTESVLLENCQRNSATIDALMIYKKAPLHYEAENYFSMHDVLVEPASEAGSNLGGMSKGSFATYTVDIAEAGTYIMHYRVSSLAGGGVLKLELFGGAEVFAETPIAETGSWKDWTTVYQLVELPAGKQTFALVAEEPGYNLNWFKISKDIPHVYAGEDITTTDTEDTGFISYILDGSQSIDPNGEIVSYTWRSNDSILSNQIIDTIPLSVGIHQLTLEVVDELGSSVKDTITIRIHPANQTYAIKSAWKMLYLNQSSNELTLSSTPDAWIFEELAPGVLEIRNEKTGDYINLEDETSHIAVTPRDSGWWSSRWSIVEINSTHTLLQSIWKSEYYIHMENETGYAEYEGFKTGWWSGRWILEHQIPLQDFRNESRIESSQEEPNLSSEEYGPGVGQEGIVQSVESYSSIASPLSSSSTISTSSSLNEKGTSPLNTDAHSVHNQNELIYHSTNTPFLLVPPHSAANYIIFTIRGERLHQGAIQNNTLSVSEDLPYGVLFIQYH